MFQEIVDFAVKYQVPLYVGGGVLAFSYGVKQYVSTRRWKSAEFVMKELSEFSDKPYTQIVFEALDSKEKAIEINYKGEDYVVEVNDERLKWLLRPRKIDGSITAEEEAFRYAFDRFLLDLEKFNYLITIGLIDKEVLQPYLGYWLEIMGKRRNGHKPEATVQAIHNYLIYYRQRGTIRLLSRFGYLCRYNEAAAGYAAPRG